VSLILEALKKLEREKELPDRGFLVLAHLPWARSGRGRAGIAGLAALALALVAAAVFLWRSWPAPSPPRIEAPPATALPAPLPPAAVVTPPAPVRTPPAPEPPTATQLEAPAPKGPPVEEEFRLNAISVQDGHPVAVLNDRIVREGDSFDGLRVLRIGETEVEVEVKGERRIIRF
jgi:hypothetical protein